MTGSATAAARRSGCSRSSLDSSGALRHLTVSHAFSTGMPTSGALRKSELHLNDTQLGLIASGFIVIYTIMSPVFGTLGDRRARPPLIALGVIVWSIATTLAGFARGFGSLLVARSTVGIGEAAYGTIAPALLSDTFPYEKRGRVLSIFFAAIPIGSAAA